MCEKTRLQQESIAKELITKLLQSEFNRNSSWWQIETAKEVIVTAKYYGLHELANQFENDLNF